LPRMLLKADGGTDVQGCRMVGEKCGLVYGPSYISFESALSWHGWIPEGVRVLTSATTKRGKEVTTPIGAFAYERIPTAAFTLGVRHMQTATESFLMADGWKALADLIYVRRRDWPDTYHITEDLRIEPKDFEDSNLELLQQLADWYPNRRTRHYLNLYYRELSTWHWILFTYSCRFTKDRH